MIIQTKDDIGKIKAILNVRSRSVIVVSPELLQDVLELFRSYAAEKKVAIEVISAENGERILHYTTLGAVIGMTVGYLLAYIPGAVIGGLTGAIVGSAIGLTIKISEDLDSYAFQIA